MAGYIGIDRDIVDHWIYKDAEYFKVWFEMLYRARYAEEPKTDMEKGQVYTVHRGEFMYGRPSWSKRIGISEQRLKTLMKKLVAHEMITLKQSYNYFSIYYVNNFEKYRKNNQQINQQSNQQEALEPQRIAEDNNQQINHQANLLSTTCQPAANLLSTTKEESKESNKENKDNKDKNISTTADDDEMYMTVMDAYSKSFGSLNMTGLIQGYIGEIRNQGMNDAFIIELLLETGESSAKPNLKLLRAIGDSWIEKGISSRKQAKEAKQKAFTPRSNGGAKVSDFKQRSTGKQSIPIAQTDTTQQVSEAEFEEMMRMAQEIQDKKHNPGA